MGAQDNFVEYLLSPLHEFDRLVGQALLPTEPFHGPFFYFLNDLFFFKLYACL